MKRDEKRIYYVSSESVTEGHPDKVCDQIADGILDAYLAQDERARVAVEVMVSKDTVMLAGEITSTAQVDIPMVTREIIRRIGYIEKGRGFDAESCVILTNISKQSADISRGVTKPVIGKEILGGGDQGIMYGYASDETSNLMPLPIELSHRLTRQLAKVRKSGKADFIYPDGKSQITMLYNEEHRPLYIHSIVISTQHSESISHEELEKFIRSEVIEPVIDKKWLREETLIHINPTGRFVIGGPAGDTGVTGRKLMVDSYGTIGKHGGGAFSGKDSTKVDRSATYMARYVAKNIVAAGLARKCEVSITYVIGGIKPESIDIETFGTETIDMRLLQSIVKHTFCFEVAEVIHDLELRKPQFIKTAAYGHFGREDEGFRWEDTDKAEMLRELAKQLSAER
ncbi:MAG: methionine adenosyltransferase [Hespellia sp.]|nr:methionine adenosyltransferase [Hespellia sp.]